MKYPLANRSILIALKSQESRIAKLEQESNNKGVLRRITSSASTSALLLGLVLTFASLYDVFWAKPRADRISRLSQFNATVNSIAKNEQDQLRLISQDPSERVAIMSATTPLILNDLSTAKAMLRDLDDKDVEIPQLIVLITAASSEGDTQSIGDFVSRAVAKQDVTPYLHAEAKRYEGKYLFATGFPEKGRQSYREALQSLGTTPSSAAARAYDLADLIAIEDLYGQCGEITEDIQAFVETLAVPGFSSQVKSDLVSTLLTSVRTGADRCNKIAGLAQINAQ